MFKIYRLFEPDIFSIKLIVIMAKSSIQEIRKLKRREHRIDLKIEKPY